MTRPLQPDAIVVPEARGYITGSALAYQVGCGLVPARRLGKLPRPATRRSYVLEYGTGALELPENVIEAGSRVVVHDDVLAIGGTSLALLEMLRQLGVAVLAFTYVVELTFLDARRRHAPIPVYAPIQY